MWFLPEQAKFRVDEVLEFWRVPKIGEILNILEEEDITSWEDFMELSKEDLQDVDAASQQRTHTLIKFVTGTSLVFYFNFLIDLI